MLREHTASVDHPHPRSASLREQTARSLRQLARGLTRSHLLRQSARRQSARSLTRSHLGLQVGSFSEKTRGSRGRKLSMLPEGQERSAVGTPRARSAGASPRRLNPMAIDAHIFCKSHFVSTRTISEPSPGALTPQPMAGVGHGV
jgi:hypothetical protein